MPKARRIKVNRTVIREFLNKQGLTLQETSLMLGRNPYYVSNVLRNNVISEEFFKQLIELGIPEDDLVSEENAAEYDAISEGSMWVNKDYIREYLGENHLSLPQAAKMMHFHDTYFNKLLMYPENKATKAAISRMVEFGMSRERLLRSDNTIETATGKVLSKPEEDIKHLLEKKIQQDPAVAKAAVATDANGERLKPEERMVMARSAQAVAEEKTELEKELFPILDSRISHALLRIWADFKKEFTQLSVGELSTFEDLHTLDSVVKLKDCLGKKSLLLLNEALTSLGKEPIETLVAKKIDITDIPAEMAGTTPITIHNKIDSCVPKEDAVRKAYDKLVGMIFDKYRQNPSLIDLDIILVIKENDIR